MTGCLCSEQKFLPWLDHSLMAKVGMQAESVHGELNPEKLEAFGGAQEVARQLARACSSQARRNLLCILLDCVLEQAAAVSRPLPP